MATPGIRPYDLSDAEHSAQLRRAIVASTVGTVIEAYDFLLYVLVAPLVFAKLFFPSSDPLVGTLQAFGIYAVGFVARRIGRLGQSSQSLALPFPPDFPVGRRRHAREPHRVNQKLA